jgi:hypothetical protein
MKDEEAIDWSEGFQNFGQGEQAQGGVMGSLPGKILCVFREKKEEDECVRKKLVIMCGENVVREKKQNVCKQRAWEEVVCSK